MIIKVKNCKNCPLHQYDYEFDLFDCNHPENQLHEELRWIDEYPKLPHWCPINTEPLTIELEK